jgi:hypothetical protein
VKLATTLMSATCHGWPYYYGTGKFLWCCTWLLLYTLATCLFQIMAKGVHFLLCFLYMFNCPMLANLQSCIVVISYCTYTEISIRKQNYLLSTQPPSFVHKHAQHIGIFWWHMITVLEVSIRYLLSNSATCLYTLYCTFAQVTVHSSIFIVRSVFYKLGSSEWKPRCPT